MLKNARKGSQMNTIFKYATAAALTGALALAAAAERTLQWATAVAVFFLPKHCTDWEAILNDCG